MNSSIIKKHFSITIQNFRKHKKLIIAGYIVKLLITAAVIGFAQEPDKKSDEIRIKSSVVCGMCKTRITDGLIYEKGIKEVNVDLPTKVITVTYNTKQTNPDKIRQHISNLGYDADGIAANPKKYDKLPACCKKDVPTHE